jgi:Ser/Thr protein kinase RdoA (MazF antagonist)
LPCSRPSGTPRATSMEHENGEGQYLTHDHAKRLAAMVARRHGIKDPIQPLRTSANHVFRAGDVVVRVAPQAADVSSHVALARWLVSEGFPVAAPLADADVAGGAKLNLWEYIHTDERRSIDFEQLGEVVARLHRIAPARLKEFVALPFCGDEAWLAIERNLVLAEAAHVVDADGLAALRRECAALRDWQDRARRDVLVVCHGDVHPKNVLMRGDDVVIIDWDAICLGPPAWDHAPADDLGRPLGWGGRDISGLRARIRRRSTRIVARPGTGCTASARADDQHAHQRRE